MYGRNQFYRPRPGQSFYTGPRQGQAYRNYNNANASRMAGDAVTLNLQAPKWVSWAELHPARAAWIVAKASSFDFAAKMYKAVIDFSDLTVNQGAAVDRCIARDAERASQRASGAPQAASATYPNIRAAFDAYVLAGGKKPITIGDVTISIAPATGANAGALYVKVGAQYCGKIVPTPAGPVFRGVRECPADLVGKLAAIEVDPNAAVRAHADRIAARIREAEARGEPIDIPCGCCGILLTDPVSRARGIGPICAGRWSF